MSFVYKSTVRLFLVLFFFFFNDTAPTEIYTLSLHDALPISAPAGTFSAAWPTAGAIPNARRDRKSTRLNSSHEWISYAVFCLKKKKHNTTTFPRATEARWKGIAVILLLLL